MIRLVFLVALFSSLNVLSQTYYSPKTTVGSSDDPGNSSVSIEDVFININESEKTIKIKYKGTEYVNTYSYSNLIYRDGVVCYYLNSNRMMFASAIIGDTSNGKFLTFLYEEPIHTMFVYGPLQKQY